MSTPASDMIDALPRLGPYLIVRTSGVGGMGRVDLALRVDGEPPEVCVLKRMHGDAHAPDQAARFEREARIAARLLHPNIARSLKVEQIDGELCLAQEYVEGVDLARLMKQAGVGGIPDWTAARIAREIAGALAYAHDFAGQEIVHRDVTPENIMIAFSGDVKLIDFGISRSGVDGTLTTLGMVIGRRAYLPPEAWAGGKPDRRTDVFGLGIVLWEMLTARRLEEVDEELWKERVPDPRDLRPEISAELAAVVLRALEPDPNARYQTAGELRDALAPWVPDDKDLRTELGAVLAFYFNVVRAKEIVAGQIDDARSMLRRPQVGVRSRHNRIAWIASAAMAVLLVSGVAISALRLHSSGSQTPSARAPATSAVPEGLRATVPVASPSARAETESRAQATSPAIIHSNDEGRDDARPRRLAPRPAALPSVAEPVEKPEVVLRAAYELFDHGDLAEAEVRARRAIAVGAGEPGHFLLGAIYMNRGRLVDAERELETAVRLDPSDAEAARRLSDVRRSKLEQGQ